MEYIIQHLKTSMLIQIIRNHNIVRLKTEKNDNIEEHNEIMVQYVRKCQS